MSETGATDAQLQEALKRSGATCCDATAYVNRRVKHWAALLVPPGYQIVPAGAVTLSAEDAADAAHGLMHAIGSVDEDDDRRIARTDDEWRAVITTWRALAAKLSGGCVVSENHYRLDLTEREQIDLLDALFEWFDHDEPWNEVERRMHALYSKVAALKPIGTGGTTEGA